MFTILQIDDWIFQIDLEKTKEHSSFVSSEHCTCDYCENFYRSINVTYPELKPFLARFGILIDGPSELYPIEATLYLAGYRVFGRVEKYGNSPIMVNGVPVSAEPVDDVHFMLEAGEMPLPWVLSIDPDEVISPANEPEFLEKMYRKLLRRNGDAGPICS